MNAEKNNGVARYRRQMNARVSGNVCQNLEVKMLCLHLVSKIQT